MDDLYDEYVQRIVFVLNKLILIRFGNFIGEAEESDEEVQNEVDAGAYVYDGDEAEEETPGATGQDLMQLDGWSIESRVVRKANRWVR